MKELLRPSRRKARFELRLWKGQVIDMIIKNDQMKQLYCIGYYLLRNSKKK